MIVSSGSEKAERIAKDLGFQLGHHLEDITIVIGGDGFLLETVRELGLNRTYLPINGGTLGFLLNDVESIESLVKKINYKEWKLHKFPTLFASFEWRGSMGSQPGADIAVNDVCIERMSSQTTRLNVTIDGSNVVEDLAADGLIVATSQGSTGYNFSAGGAVCQYSTDVMAITSICAHHPRLPPFVVPSSSEVTIEATQTDKRPVKVTIDGREYPNASMVKIIPGDKLKILYFNGHNFTNQLVTKILRR